MKIIETYFTGGFSIESFIYAMALIIVGLLGLVIIFVICDKYREMGEIPLPAVLCAILVCVGIWFAISSNTPRVTHKVVKVNINKYEEFCKEYGDDWEIEKDVIKNNVHEITMKEKTK